MFFRKHFFSSSQTIVNSSTTPLASSITPQNLNSSTTPSASSITPQYVNTPHKTFSPRSFNKQCVFEEINCFQYTLRLDIDLPSVYSPIFGVPSSAYHECINFLFSGHIPGINDPKFIAMYIQLPPYFNNNPHSQLLNLPYVRPSGIFTLLEVISNTQRTDIGRGQITLADVVCTSEIDTQFKNFYPIHSETAKFDLNTVINSIHNYITQDQIMYLRFVCHEYINQNKFIHYGHSPIIISNNNRQSLSRTTLSLSRQLENNPRDPMIIDFLTQGVTSHHMVSPLLYLNCLSELSLHTLYSFIMALMQARNGHSTRIKSDVNITVILQNSHVLDRTSFITADHVTNSIYEYLNLDVNIIHEGINRFVPQTNVNRPCADEYIPDLAKLQTNSSYVTYDDGFLGIAPFSLSDITDDIVTAGALFSHNFCTRFFSPILTQLFFSPNSNLTLSDSSNKLTCSNIYHLIPYTSHSIPDQIYSKPQHFIPSIRIPSRISHPSSLISLYHSVYYNHCRQRQWHLFQPLGIQHLSLSMYTVALGYSPNFVHAGRPFNYFSPRTLTFEYLVSTKSLLHSPLNHITTNHIPLCSLEHLSHQTPLPLRDVDINNTFCLSQSKNEKNPSSNDSNVSQLFDHLSLPPSLSPLHPHYFNTSERNSTSLTPIFSLIEPDKSALQTLNFTAADLFSQLPSQLHDDNFNHDFSIQLDLNNRAQIYKFKYAGEVTDYKDNDYTANIHYFRCPTSQVIHQSPSQLDSPNHNNEVTLESKQKINHNSSTRKEVHGLEIRIISPDVNYPSRPCRILPVLHSVNVLNNLPQILFTLPMNQIIALEYYLQRQKSFPQTLFTHTTTDTTPSTSNKQCESFLTSNNFLSPAFLETGSLKSQNDLSVDTSFDTSAVSSLSFHYIPSDTNNELVTTRSILHKNTIQQPSSTIPTITLPIHEPINPLSNSVNQYHHIELHNEFTSSSSIYHTVLNQVTFQPFSCPGIILLTPYSQQLPFLYLYSAEFYRYTASLVQIDINIPFFFVTVLPEKFDITTAKLGSLTPNDSPYLGWDTTFPVDRLKTFFEHLAANSPPIPPLSTALTASTTSTTSAPSTFSPVITPTVPTTQVQSDTIINFQRDLIFQQSRHIQVFSTIVPQDMNEYLAIKKITPQNEKIELTHSHPKEKGSQISHIQHFLQEFQKQQADAGLSCERSMFHFIVSGIDGYTNALPFINKCALAHYFSYRLQPEV